MTDEAQYNIAILCRRLYGKRLAPRAEHLRQRVEEIQEGKYDQELVAIKALSESELRERYNCRDVEPE